MAAIKLTSNDHLWRLTLTYVKVIYMRLLLLLSPNEKILIKLNGRKRKFETKKETFVWITILRNWLLGSLYHVGILYYCCKIARRIGNLDPQP